MTDSKKDNQISPIEYFRVKAAEAPSSRSRDVLTRALNSLAAFIGYADISFSQLADSLVEEWAINLLFHGYSPKTISNNHVKRLATLYNHAVADQLAPYTDTFCRIQAILNSESLPKFPLSANILPRLLTILQAPIPEAPTHGHNINIHNKDIAPSSPDSHILARDILMLALSQGILSLTRIANFRKDDYKGENPELQRIIRRHARPRNRYLFPLDQIHSTPRQLERRILSLLTELLSPASIPLSPNPVNTLRHLWQSIALSIGVTPTEINITLPLASTSAETPATTPKEICKKIEAQLCSNPLRWYAMHLRPHVDFRALTRRLQERHIHLDRIYYPYHEIINAASHPRPVETRPIIGWLIFFRAHPADLDNLFHNIGDLAWGYRYNRSLTSPYAIIPDREIKEYQQAIATISPATRLLTDEEAEELHAGDPLIMLGAPFHGRQAIFLSRREIADPKAPGGHRILYRIRLGDTNLNWTADWDPAMLRRTDAIVH